MSATINGRLPRTQLSDQIERLDTMLDGLSEALNETIAGAARDGTRLALKDAVIEILTDPALRAKLRDATEPVKEAVDPVKNTSFWQAAKARMATAGRALKSGAATVVSFAASAAVSVVAAIRNPARIAALVSNLHRRSWASAALAIAVVSHFARHKISAALSGITAAATAISIRVSNWTRRAIQAVA